jgi:hypothetical protein
MGFASKWSALRHLRLVERTAQGLDARDYDMSQLSALLAPQATRLPHDDWGPDVANGAAVIDAFISAADAYWRCLPDFDDEDAALGRYNEAALEGVHQLMREDGFDEQEAGFEVTEILARYAAARASGDREHVALFEGRFPWLKTMAEAHPVRLREEAVRAYARRDDDRSFLLAAAVAAQGFRAWRGTLVALARAVVRARPSVRPRSAARTRGAAPQRSSHTGHARPPDQATTTPHENLPLI